MGLDIRVPLGLIFLITGGLLTVYGFATRANEALYAPSMGINLNLGCGIIMVLFGLTMFLLGWRRRA